MPIVKALGWQWFVPQQAAKTTVFKYKVRQLSQEFCD
jgi:hypothetical protein